MPRRRDVLRLCKYCGAEYDGDPGGSCCPACAAEQRKTSLRERVCSVCGVMFTGGPSVRYCPDCRIERQRQTNRAYKQRRAAGNVRQIGSTSVCEICGEPYTVTGGLQKYCPVCAPEAIRQKDNAASRRWNAENTTAEQRRAERQAATAPIPCVVCGKMFVPTTAALTCSAACSKELTKRRAAQWEQTHREERAEYHAQKDRARIAAMTPEEYRAYRERVNARAREAYKRRKEKND